MNKWVVLFFVLALLTAFCIVLQPTKGVSEAIVVPDDYATIQAAIDAAPAGATVFVKSGTYLNQSLVITKPILLIGENQKTTILQGKGDVYPVPQSSVSSTGATEVTILGYETSLLNFIPRIEIVIKLNASDVTISGFTIENCNKGITGAGDRTRIVGNTITANGESCISLEGSNMTVANNSLFGRGSASGVSFGGSYTNVTGNKIVDISVGITFLGQFNSVSGNTILGNSGFGMQVMGSFHVISNNNVTGGRMGFRLGSCSGSIFNRNVVMKQTERALYVDSSDDNVLHENYIGSNQGRIIYFSGTSKNNKLYDNTFMNNSNNMQFFLNNQTNSWDNGTIGNYWSDYSGADANHDGIGDTPYVINEKNADNLPLMNPSVTAEVAALAADPSASPASSPTSTVTPPNPEPFPTGQAIAIFASVMVAVVGLFVFFKKSRNHAGG
jgi:parallel beta-helix repeat protein